MQIKRAPISQRSKSELEGSPLAIVDAPGASQDRARHHFRDDDADDAELAVLSALVGKINA